MFFIDMLNDLYPVNRMRAFLIESNKIEDIHNTDKAEILLQPFTLFLYKDNIKIKDLIYLTTFMDGNIRLRDKQGLDVRVGNYVPPLGDPDITEQLNALLDAVVDELHPFEVHKLYETLHPFTDGNGRTGRMLWAWQMVNQHNYDFNLGFLHMFYYQTLSHGR